MESCTADTATLVAATIESVIADRAVRTVFQPVVHLASKAVVGFEALSRGPAGTVPGVAVGVDRRRSPGRPRR